MLNLQRVRKIESFPKLYMLDCVVLDEIGVATDQEEWTDIFLVVGKEEGAFLHLLCISIDNYIKPPTGP